MSRKPVLFLLAMVGAFSALPVRAQSQPPGDAIEITAFTDEQVDAFIEQLGDALEANDQSRIRVVRARNSIIARGLKNNRVLSGRQVERLVDALAGFKEKYPNRANMLDGEIFKIANLTIGREAPNIEGVDTDEVSFQLTDYRGKVVVIDFWGDW